LRILAEAAHPGEDFSAPGVSGKALFALRHLQFYGIYSYSVLNAAGVD